MRAQAGFTLMELAVAILVLAILAAIGYGTINQAVRTRSTLKDEQAQLLALQSALRTLEQDLVQATPRPVRQPVGDEPAQVAFGGAAGTGTDAAQPLLALTRLGWANPAGLPRSSLQRVAYFLENGTLRREYWTVLDPTLASKPLRRDLLTHVKSLRLRFMDVGHVWQAQWPPATNCQGCKTQEQSLRQRPIAVEITLETEAWGTIVRIIEIPA